MRGYRTAIWARFRALRGGASGPPSPDVPQVGAIFTRADQPVRARSGRFVFTGRPLPLPPPLLGAIFTRGDQPVRARTGYVFAGEAPPLPPPLGALYTRGDQPVRTRSGRYVIAGAA